MGKSDTEGMTPNKGSDNKPVGDQSVSLQGNSGKQCRAYSFQRFRGMGVYFYTNLGGPLRVGGVQSVHFPAWTDPWQALERAARQTHPDPGGWKSASLH